MIKKNGTVTKLFDFRHRMRNQKYCRSGISKSFKDRITLLPEKHIPHCQSLINDDNRGIDVRLNRKGKAQKHTAGECFYRLVDELANVGEVNDLIIPGFDFFFGESQNAPIQKNVIAPRKIRIKATSKFQQCGDAAIYRHVTTCSRQSSCYDLEKGTFAASITANDAECFAKPHAKRDIVKCPKVPEILPGRLADLTLQARQDKLFEPVTGCVVNLVSFAEIGNLNSKIFRGHQQIPYVFFGTTSTLSIPP
ncbi:hypothetical protein DSCA_10000 [Desulfosarcina alkanivorans]|uniref:Uncharacterized protein n=1 Tax=Desulfosarcina alkanivorans TaxID=571177 RepID=A0A5K7YG74_9BACT|nr:hypothetical protein DSCA_10000 [Desulfosarcina alkanivorans]